MTMQTPVIGIVLAGGQSARMGRDKAELCFNQDHCQLERTEQLLKDAGCERVLVSRNKPGRRFIPDQFPESGPLAGIHACLADYFSNPEARGQSCQFLICPVDIPLMDHQHLTVLVAESKKSAQHCFYCDHYLPCAITVNAEALNELTRRLSEGQRAVQHWLKSLKAQALPLSQPQKLINTNTPEQWQQAMHLATNNHQLSL